MPEVKNARTKLAQQKYPVLDSILSKIEGKTHQLELVDGRHASLKYLDPIYAYYLKSKKRATRKRDMGRICELRSLKVRGKTNLFAVLIRATSSLPRSTVGKYVDKLRAAEAKDVRSEDFVEFTKKAKSTVKSAGRGPSTRTSTVSHRVVPRLSAVDPRDWPP